MGQIVADTTPLNYLVLIGSDRVLPELYGSVLVPTQVLEELRHPSTPEPVRTWATRPPSWVDIRLGDPARFPALDLGESAALAMAVSTNTRLLADDAEARSAAKSLGVPVIGTIGVLAEAHLRAHLDFEAAVSLLTNTSFRVSNSVISLVREQLSKRLEGV